MWCENCQADRAAEASAETKHVTCATCGAKLSSQQFGKLDRQMQQARDLLERWSKEPLLEPYSPIPDKQAAHLRDLRREEKREPAEEPSASDLLDSPADEAVDVTGSIGDRLEEVLAKTRATKFRFDASHAESENREEQTDSAPAPHNESETNSEVDEAKVPPITDGSSPPQAQNAPEKPKQAEPIAEFHPSTPAVKARYRRIGSKVHRNDPPPEQTAPPPHLNVQQLIEERMEHKQGKVNWMMMVGQWLAYLGVLAMTAGAAVIVFGYFGGAEGMTPRGWMLTTAGQMLLFLGIVTLISSGMERSSEEITDRIEILGEQLIRFETETRAHFLAGPKISPAAYTESENLDSPETEPQKKESPEGV